MRGDPTFESALWRLSLLLWTLLVIGGLVLACAVTR